MRIRLFHACIALSAVAIVLTMTGCARVRPTQDAAYAESLAVFERRILPILRSPHPSSCVECHLSGVDLSGYILPTAEGTFRSLRDQGLVNTAEPAKSRILDLIRMSKPESDRLTQQARQAELDAFAAWLQASVRSPALLNAPPLPAKELAGPGVPLEVIRHTREDRVFHSFMASVWAQIERCAGCHAKTAPEIEKNIAKYGPRVLWVKDTSEQTFRHILDSGFVHTDRPTESLMLLKPTMQVEHGGGKKMEIGDLGYKQFRAWIEDYVASVRGTYTSVEDLPAPSDVEYIGSEIWLNVAPTPEAWADKVLGVLVYPYDEAAGRFSQTPTATSDRRVWGAGKLWQHNLILMAPSGSELAESFRATRRLPSGKYLLRFYLDRDGDLEKDWRAELNAPERAVGSAEVATDWHVGYNRMTVVTSVR
ncbi:hypothetical protein FJZ36_07190 [Candidatus Poribacteria bacterium]|nr:hypothetical protein [Candidatus Poribacteria bacterium]